jgi:predicted regulator of Ras-like GTPase activity (Roadblock/LC7/MglB family)
VDFKAALREILSSVDGALGAGLIGLDGLVVDQVSMRPGLDFAQAGGEYAVVMKGAMSASDHFGWGGAQEVLISSDQGTAILVAAGKAHFLVLALDGGGNPGRGRLELKKSVPAVERALA